MPAILDRTSAAFLICGVLAALSSTVHLDAQRSGATNERPRSELAIVAPESAPGVQKYGKFEIAFKVTGTSATMLHWPYDPAPPRGIPPGEGISVEGVFTDTSGRVYSQPAFLYQRFEDDVRNGRDWHYPTSDFNWKVRFSPNAVSHFSGRKVEGRCSTAAGNPAGSHSHASAEPAAYGPAQPERRRITTTGRWRSIDT